MTTGDPQERALPTRKESLGRALSVVSDGLMTIEEVARFLAISRAFVYKLMDDGALPFVKIGRSRRVPRSAVAQLAAKALQGGERR